MMIPETFHGSLCLQVAGRLLTAGIPLTEGIKTKIERYTPESPPELFFSQNKQEEVVKQILEDIGFQYPPKDLNSEKDYAPNAGHIVVFDQENSPVSFKVQNDRFVLTGKRNGTQREQKWSIGHISGNFYYEGHDFHPDTTFTLSSGGPASIGPCVTDRNLRLLPVRGKVKCWCFWGSPRAHTGIYYTREMPVWEYSI